jgi:hypothetical protein
VSDGVELSLRISPGEFSHSLDICAHNGPGSESRLCILSTDSYACFPLPSSGCGGRSLRKPCGSTLSSVLWGCKTARHPSVLPSVDPRVAPTFDPYRGDSSRCEGNGDPSWVPGQPLWNMPWVLDTADPDTTSQNGHCPMLPSVAAKTSASELG